MFTVVVCGRTIAYRDTLDDAEDFAKQFSAHATMMTVNVYREGSFVSTFMDGRFVDGRRVR